MNPKPWINPVGLTLIPTTESESFRDMPEGTTGLPLAPHPGAFGVQRKNHTHEGVDLYLPDRAPVMAVEDGLIVAVIDFTGENAVPPSPWWHNTKALLVEGDTGVVVYGEIDLALDYWPGDLIKGGDVIGYVTPVLKKDKGRPMTMLHLELHRHGTSDAYEWTVDGPRPESLLDPTPYLLASGEV
jgi:murein DD-endopeptidase MepM/ murein hydrolase activator NlpD